MKRKALSSATLALVLALLLVSVASMQSATSVTVGTVDGSCQDSVQVPVSIQGPTDVAGVSLLVGLPGGTSATLATGACNASVNAAFSSYCTGAGGAFVTCNVADVNDGTTGLSLYQIDLGCVFFAGGTGLAADAGLMSLTVNRNGDVPDSLPLNAVPTDGAGTNSILATPAGTSAALSDGQLIDGNVRWCPTAVELAGMDASPASSVMNLWPLLAGGMAVAAGGAYALLRRKR